MPVLIRFTGSLSPASGSATTPPSDTDSDSISDDSDNCDNDANVDQADTDSDGEGDVCDTDDDGDGTYDDTDCNDADAAVHPGATETCNNVDDDCDGDTDEDLPMHAYYVDLDGDGYGGIGVNEYCETTPPAGRVAASGDCNEDNAAINPSVAEICDSIDNNCSGAADEGVKTTYYRDTDGDDYGLTTNFKKTCTKPSGYIRKKGDCNDTCRTCYPGASIILLDGKDNNCDGRVE
jgi:hypothetical protein